MFNGSSIPSANWSIDTIKNNTGSLSLPIFDNAHKYKATYTLGVDGFVNNVTITNN